MYYFLKTKHWLRNAIREYSVATLIIGAAILCCIPELESIKLFVPAAVGEQAPRLRIHL